MLTISLTAQDLVIGHTSYAPLPETNPTMYVQNNATAQLLTRIANANKEILSDLHISQKHPSLKAPIRPNMSLHTLATMGASDPEIAWPIFQALWKELTAKEATTSAEGQMPFKPRPPMLVTIDSVGHWMKDSNYRNAEYEIIHAHDLVFVNHFISLLTESSLPNGGMVLLSTSQSNVPSNYSFDVALKQVAARSGGVAPNSTAYPLADPYLVKSDDRVLSLFNKAQTLRTQHLSGLTKDETRGLLEYYARSGILREKISEDNVGEKWSLAGGGIVGALDKLGQRLRVMPPMPSAA